MCVYLSYGKGTQIFTISFPYIYFCFRKYSLVLAYTINNCTGDIVDFSTELAGKIRNRTKKFCQESK